MTKVNPFKKWLQSSYHLFLKNGSTGNRTTDSWFWLSVCYLYTMLLFLVSFRLFSVSTNFLHNFNSLLKIWNIFEKKKEVHRNWTWIFRIGRLMCYHCTTLPPFAFAFIVFKYHFIYASLLTILSINQIIKLIWNHTVKKKKISLFRTSKEIKQRQPLSNHLKINSRGQCLSIPSSLTNILSNYWSKDMESTSISSNTKLIILKKFVMTNLEEENLSTKNLIKMNSLKKSLSTTV